MTAVVVEEVNMGMAVVLDRIAVGRDVLVGMVAVVDRPAVEEMVVEDIFVDMLHIDSFEVTA